MRRSIRVERRLGAPPNAAFAILADHARYDRFDGMSWTDFDGDLVCGF